VKAKASHLGAILKLFRPTVIMSHFTVLSFKHPKKSKLTNFCKVVSKVGHVGLPRLYITLRPFPFCHSKLQPNYRDKRRFPMRANLSTISMGE